MEPGEDKKKCGTACCDHPHAVTTQQLTEKGSRTIQHAPTLGLILDGALCEVAWIVSGVPVRLRLPAYGQHNSSKIVEETAKAEI